MTGETLEGCHVGECIHGLEDGLCDVCFPKTPRAAAPRARTARASATPARTPRSAGRVASTAAGAGAGAAGRGAAGKASPARHGADIGEQRIYHVTHIGNLAGILESHAVLADAGGEKRAQPAVDISSEANREARRGMRVAGEAEPAVAGYVPFFLSPNAGVWESIRSQSPDPRLSAEAYRHSPYDYVILVSTVKKALGGTPGPDEGDIGASVIVANGDVTGTFTRFGVSRDAGESMLRSLRAGEESDAIRAAELLVRESFPVEQISLIGVANDKVRTAVRGILAGSDTRHAPKVVVYPPWFQPAGTDGAAG